MKGEGTHFNISRLATACRLCLAGSVLCTFLPVSAATTFDAYALQQAGPGTPPPDLSIFNNGGQPPGVYRTDIYVNGRMLEARDVRFELQDDKLVPELTAGDWAAFGVNLEAFPALAALSPDERIPVPSDYVPDTSAALDFRLMRLNISIPQVALTQSARQSIDPSRWDNGIPALLLNYNVSASNNRFESSNDSKENRSLFVALNPGVNLGPWRLRNYSTYSRSSDGNKNSWNTAYTYLQRSIASVRGQLTLGETSTTGDVIDSVRFRGIQLVSDDNMLPDSLRGFAPVVRGIANSNAQVTVRQNGSVIYQTYVASGAFAIRDLYPTSSSGNLEVTIREADGSERSFIQAFSAVPGMMLREGQWRYSVAAGRYRADRIGSSEPEFLQSTLQYGLPNNTTIYGGTTLSRQYQAVVAGFGQGLGMFGSLSFDVTTATTRLPMDGGQRQTGQSYRAQYSKDVFQSGTTFTLAGYRYSTANYYDFREANESFPQNGNPNGSYAPRYYNKRSRMQAQINQNLGTYGSFYLSAYQQDYWRMAGRERTFTVGYNTTINGISYGLNLADTRSPRSGSDRQLAFNVQIPLNRWQPGAYANYGLNVNRRQVQHQAGLSGTALEDNALNYNLAQGYSANGAGSQTSIAANLRSGYGNLRGSYSTSRYGQQASASMEGAVVLHPYGVTISQPLGSSAALVKAPGSAGAQVMNKTGVSTDWRGYTVVPYLSAYRENRLALDPQTLPDNVDMDNLVKTLVPTDGALVLAEFKTSVGHRVLLTLMRNGKPLPFGATATLSAEGEDIASGIVDDKGELYLSGVPLRGDLKVSWGRAKDQSCSAELILTEDETNSPIILRTLNCS